jgi:GT2 family glycosyltransferase
MRDEIAPDNQPMSDLAAPAVTVAVVILTVNQRETTLRCLASLRGVKSPDHRVLVWDNGSNDGTVAAVVDADPDVVVHRHPRNLGVASGRNAAAALAMQRFNPRYLAFIDNDMLVSPDFLQALVAPFANDPRLGQAQAKIRLLRDPQRLNDGGGNRIQFWLGRTRPVGFGELDHGQYDQPRRCVSCGGAMVVRTDVFRMLGGFDPVFDPFGPEDLDFSLRLARAGYYALYVPGAVVFHEVSHTFGGGSYTEGYARLKARHWFVFMRRHAPLHEQLAFFCVGAPYRLLRLIIREVKRGNVAAVRGIGRGLADHLVGLVRNSAVTPGRVGAGGPSESGDPSGAAEPARPGRVP